MLYQEYIKLISSPRFNRFLLGSGGDYDRAIKLYMANIRLSQKCFAVISLFEIAFRNAVDDKYKSHFGIEEWLLLAKQPMGFLNQPDCINSLSRIEDVLNANQFVYSHNALVAKLSFGFWNYLFAKKQYEAGGKVLLSIFKNRPAPSNPKIKIVDYEKRLFKELISIGDFRNRIAHHEPICFGKEQNWAIISIDYAKKNFQLILKYFIWMGYDPSILLKDLDEVEAEIFTIQNI